MSEESVADPRERVREERDAARAFAEQHGIREPELADLLLIVSELVSNAIVHARGLRQVTLSLDGEFITIAVEQNADPPPERPGPDALGGRGLVIVWALAEEITDTRTARLRAWPVGRHRRPGHGQ